ncbi:MAG: ABC transporter ATP-binding protein, partial [Gemmatimonadetes bacterium]|nr:ABC transporter ATP-binding protein [Gemmatimonadota bacterium]
EARGLGVAWPGDAGPPLFEGLDAVVAAGEVLAVVGPSGSGKTTLLRVLGGITRPWKGSVRPPAAGRPGARVAFVPQFAEAQLFAPTVAEDVAFAPGRAGLPRAEAAERSAEALRRVGLDPVVHGKAFPLDLSQGERRRAALAGVLSAEPNVLLLDEPETGLDPPGRRLLLDIMASLLARGVGLCVATHQPGWLAPLPGRTLLLCREGGWGTGAEHPRGA